MMTGSSRMPAVFLRVQRGAHLGADRPTCYELEEIDLGILSFSERVWAPHGHDPSSH
jgi:hypothetical protein